MKGKTLGSVVQAKFQTNIPIAQYKVDTQIMNDMTPYMPMVTGTFVNLVRMRNASLAGTGMVCAATGVMGRYLYYGNRMVDSKTGKGARPIRLQGGEIIFRFRRGAVLVPTATPLNYSTGANAMAGSHWFERAKADHYQDWVKTIKGALKNGK